MDKITLEQLKAVLPKATRRVVTEETVNTINSITDEDGPMFAKIYRENFLSYSKAMRSGNFKTMDYMNAVKYVSYKLMEFSNIDAYMLTFPDRYERLCKEFASETIEWIRDNKISPFVSIYNKNDLVNIILEQTLVPTHVLNAPLFQEALNVQAVLMTTARSEMVRSTAATSILTYCKPPELSKLEVSIGYDDEQKSVQAKLVDHIGAIALNQQKMLASGMSIGEIQKLNIVAEDVIDVETDEDDE